MEIKRNVSHSFNILGIDVGDKFLGCPSCWFRLDPNTAAAPICPNCGSGMNIYTVTKDDLDFSLVKSQ